MSKQPIYSESEDVVYSFRSELVKVILEEDLSAPWNPDSLEFEVNLTELEDNFALCDCLEADELDLGANRLFSNLSECWSNTDTSLVKLSLWERFGQFVPSQQLEKILAYAQNIVDLNLSPLEQLIQCVKPLLSNWSEDDLQVFARPLVYAMRGSTELKQADWDELSEIDQVRLTMKIAQEAINHFQKQNLQSTSDLDG